MKLKQHYINETTCEETARREVMEEICVTLGELQLVKVIQSDYYGSQPEELTYIVVMTAFVQDILPENYIHESLVRSIIDIEQFISQYEAGDKNDMRRIVLDAKNLLFGSC